MDDKIPYIVYEGEQARHERTVKRLVIALVIAIMVTFVSNLAWLYYINQFEYYGLDQEIAVETKDGIANFIGENGVIRNGADSGETTSEGGS